MVDILLVEDNLGDIRLVREALRLASVETSLHVVRDGESALRFLEKAGTYANSPRPHAVLLDLNLPGVSGLEILRNVKDQTALASIPVIVLTTSNDPKDINASYEAHANCYVTKPFELNAFALVMKKIDEFWFKVAQVPQAN